MKTVSKTVSLVFLMIAWLMWLPKVVAEDYTFSRAWQEIQQISDVLAAEQANDERSEWYSIGPSNLMN